MINNWEYLSRLNLGGKTAEFRDWINVVLMLIFQLAHKLRKSVLLCGTSIKWKHYQMSSY